MLDVFQRLFSQDTWVVLKYFVFSSTGRIRDLIPSSAEQGSWEDTSAFSWTAVKSILGVLRRLRRLLDPKPPGSLPWTQTHKLYLNPAVGAKIANLNCSQALSLMLKDICIHDTEILLSKMCIIYFFFISVPLISDNYLSTFISLCITFYRQISLMMTLYPPITVTWLTSSTPFSYTDRQLFYCSSSFDIILFPNTKF